MMSGGWQAMNEPGTLSLMADGSLLIAINEERYTCNPTDVRSLIFYGRVVPVTRVIRQKQEDHTGTGAIAIEGHATVNRSGKAVVFYTREGHFLIPLVSFQRVARGEAVSAPLFPLIPWSQDGPA